MTAWEKQASCENIVRKIYLILLLTANKFHILIDSSAGSILGEEWTFGVKANNKAKDLEVLTPMERESAQRCRLGDHGVKKLKVARVT